MKYPLLVSQAGALLLLAAIPPLHAQAFEGEIGLRTPSGAIDALIKGNRARLNIQSAMGAGPIILNPAQGEMYIVIEPQKMYMVMKLEDAASMVDSAIRTRATGNGTLTSLGRTDTVAGHGCEVFRFLSATAAEDICIASGLGHLGVLGVFGGMGSGMGMGRRPAGPTAPGWAGQLARTGGFPLRVADTTGVIRYEITRIQSKPVADSLLVPPAGFQRMDMPGMGRPPQGG